MSDEKELDETVSKDIEAMIGRAGGETNPPVEPHEDLEPDNDLSGLPDEVAEDIRHAAGGAPGP